MFRYVVVSYHVDSFDQAHLVIQLVSNRTVHECLLDISRLCGLGARSHSGEQFVLKVFIFVDFYV
jgi:hypothetical protein